MKNLIGLPVLGLVFVFSTGAVLIDKETKTTVQELNYKYERLIQLDYERHQELMRVLKEVRDLAAKKTTVHVIAPRAEPTVQAPAAATAAQVPASASTPVPAPAVTPAATPAAAPVAEEPTAAVPPTAIVEAPVALPAAPAEKTAPAVETPLALPPPTPAPLAVAPAPAPPPVLPDRAVVEDMGRAVTASPEPAPAAIASAVEVAPPVAVAPVAPVSEIKITIPEDVSQQLKQSQSFALLALIVAGISLVSMGFLIITVRKSDERLRRMVWKSEVDHLRDEVIGGRPHLKVERSYDRLTLTNTGSVAADDIRLSLGPAPATMKQRLKVLARIEEGEKAEVEIGPQAAGGQIYGTLEYKNPDNDRIFKDHFVLKVDGVTGELIPIQQAS
ncbi:MAG TPA: hypothetical protein VLJ37_03885 [bacterium]|nr:hypothetical protein [bacterium]